MLDPLASFSGPVHTWFRESFGEPTAPQAEGWPAIQRGDDTLILAPTGSGKTIAAFLWGIDQIYRELAEDSAGAATEPKATMRSLERAADRSPAETFDLQSPSPSFQLPVSSLRSVPGVRLLYISPLKALNNDIERNLRAPLEGIRQVAERMGEPWPHVRVAVRTGDTPGQVRAQMVKHPPHILITTPESLYLILTSPRAREMLRTVHTVIVDEIHTLSGNKRGVHLSLTLERLERLVKDSSPSCPHVQRIGLSATQRPLEEVARFLGGQEWSESGELVPRPVTIVDTGYHKALDLKVLTVVEDFGAMPGKTIWPSVVAHLLGDIRRHRTTLVFANNRRLAERTADRLNAQLAAEQSEEIPPGSTEALAPGGLVRDRGIFALGAEGPIRAHHGSMAKERRRELEEQLKAGRLPALVGTSSLELGIDIGSVDLVAQLQSPKSVAQGLQRVGRSGHLVGQTSRGRIYATFREDLVEAAAIAHGMLAGTIEPTYTPRNPLDVLAQQILAIVALEPWPVPPLYRLVRQAYAYQDLSERSFRSVLEMLGGRYYRAAMGDDPSPDRSDTTTDPQPSIPPSVSALRARLSWDRVNDRLAALPGAGLLAVSNAGTIPDTGAYGVYLSDGQTRVGELDEEFVFETHPGDAFLFGSQVWRVIDIQDDRLIVTPAPGTVPRMPFWKGDDQWRPYELGQRIGQFRGELAERISDCGLSSTSNSKSEIPNTCPTARSPAAELRGGAGPQSIASWLREEYVLDDNSVRNLVTYVQQQLNAVGVMSSDRTIVAETFQDAVGERRLVLHSPFGGRVNGAWAIALRSLLRERLGTEPEMMANDDGILFRFPQQAGPPPLDLITGLTPAEARERILRELPTSAVFGAQFRMAAGRALLLPRSQGRRRTPFWLQRLKAKDLLALVRRFGDFPIVAEAYRTCLRDVLDLAHLEEVLAGIQSGQIRVVPAETLVPSPIASELLFYFMNNYMYEWDVPKAERDLQALALRREVLSDVLAEKTDLSDLLRPEATQGVAAERRHEAAGYQARSAEELAVHLLELGDLSVEEVEKVCAAGHLKLEAGSLMLDAGSRFELPASSFELPVWLAELADAGRVLELSLPTTQGAVSRWVPVELVEEYRAAFDPDGGDGDARRRILRRYLHHAGPVTRQAILDRYAFPEGWLDEELAKLQAAGAVAFGRFTQVSESDEYCDMGLLEQIHRRSLAQLRREVRPVSLAVYAAFLCHWQHLAAASRVAGSDGLKQVLGQLRGVALPAALWEREVLPARVSGYRPGDLAGVFGGGGLVWTGSGGDALHARLRLFFRGDGQLFLGEPDTTNLSQPARAAYDFLREEGASFLTDLEAGTGLGRGVLAPALVELALAGLATNDSLAALEAVLASAVPGAAHEHAGGGRPRRPVSTLEAELSDRLAGKARPLTQARYREAKQHVRRQLAHGKGLPMSSWAAGNAVAQTERSADTDYGDTHSEEAYSSGDLAAGRWSLVHRSGVLGPALSPEERAARQAQVLLARYGIVSRDCLAREDGPYAWPALYTQFKRLEMRGEVRRGYFVSGLSGAQFALPEAVEALRAVASAPCDEVLALNATDPANLYGGEIAPNPGADLPVTQIEPTEQAGELTGSSTGQIRFSRVPSTHVVLWQGQPVLVAEDRGSRLSALPGVSAEVVRRAVEAHLALPSTPRHLVVSRWNGNAVWGSSGETLLKSLGFYRSPAGMEWWRPQA